MIDFDIKMILQSYQNLLKFYYFIDYYLKKGDKRRFKMFLS